MVKRKQMKTLMKFISAAFAVLIGYPPDTATETTPQTVAENQ